MVYRVWFHPRRGSDFARHYKSKSAAASAARKSKIAEKVVYVSKGRSLISPERAIPLSKIKIVKKVRRTGGIVGFAGYKPPRGFM